ncbi:uncharacterized protein BdWA1_004166 [Babesia duncani]|uniref:Uncharacterized protein n=1 Tax=Babesia duncani TaxID=323732 RepID=A0AAD9PGG3_9APIC|nr:hypothetical protein BdWA1_004166 [Babesia duncani]
MGESGGSSGSSSSTSVVIIILVILSVFMVLAGGWLIDSEISTASDGSIGSVARFLGYLLCFGGFVAAVIAFVVMAIVNKSAKSAKSAKPASSSPVAVAVIIILVILSVFMVLAGVWLIDSEISTASNGSVARFLGYLLCFGGLVAAVIAFVVMAIVNKSAKPAKSAKPGSSSPVAVAVIIILVILSVFMVLAGVWLIDSEISTASNGSVARFLGYLLCFGGIVAAVIAFAVNVIVDKPAESAKSVGSAESSPVTVAVWITLVISSVLMVLAGSLLLAFRDYLVDHLDLDDLEDQWLGLLGGFLLFAGLVGVVIIVVIAFVVGKSDKPAKPAGQGGTAGQGGSRRSGSPGKSPPPSPVAVAVLITLVILSGLMCLAGGLLIDSEIARVSDGSIGSAFRFLGYLLCFGGFVTAVIAFVVNAAVNKSVGSAESSPGSVAVIIILLILSVFMLLAGLVLLVFRYYQVDPLKLLDLVNQKEEVNQVEVKRRNLR